MGSWSGNSLWRPPEGEAPPAPKKGSFRAALEENRKNLANRAARNAGYAGVVQNTPELSRILNIPRRKLDLENFMDLTPVFRKAGGTMTLRPIQSAALLEMHYANGLFAPIPVGGGKTLVLLLAAEAMDSERTVLLVPPQLRDQLVREIDDVYGKHFNLPLNRIVRVVAYSELSLAKNAELLDELNPDLIVADEAHKISRTTSARTKRFLRYMRENPHCRFVGLSGTMTNRSVLDYAALMELALRKNAPLPVGYNERKEWAGALDVDPAIRMMPGALRKLCVENENVRQGYRRRLNETQGVVSQETSGCPASLYINNVRPDTGVPDSVMAALEEVNNTWAYNGEEYADPLSMWRFRRQMSSGFYYRWVWPDDKPDVEWLEARSAWKKFAREVIKRGISGLDSEFLVSQAAERWRLVRFEDKEFKPGTKILESEEWLDWRAVKSRYNPTPPTEAVWVDEFIIGDVIARAKRYVKRGRKVIIWYSHQIIGNKLAEMSGFKHYGAGTDASPSKEKVIICSIPTQGTGKNLQHYDTNIVVTMPTSGKDFEQLTGRTHRPGQMADEVILDYYDHTFALDECMDKVVRDALYIEDSTGQKQKVLYADGEAVKQKKMTLTELREEQEKKEKENGN